MANIRQMKNAQQGVSHKIVLCLRGFCGGAVGKIVSVLHSLIGQACLSQFDKSLLSYVTVKGK